MIFYVGLHHPGDAIHFRHAFVSINALKNRRKPISHRRVPIDSGAFTLLNKHGHYPEPVEAYAQQLYDLWVNSVVRIDFAVAQDYMCEPFVLAKTGLTIPEHQRLTVERYDGLVAALKVLFEGAIPFPIMPVLQGFAVSDYLQHLAMYGERLTPGMRVGVGSVCKRQGKVAVIEELLTAIKEVRPDLRLHGFWRQDHVARQRARAPAALQRRQHGLEFRGSEKWAQRQRLARSEGFRRPRRATADHVLTVIV